VELNRDRLRVQQIMDMSTAFSIAMGHTEVPEQWLNLIAETPEEAASLRRSQTLNALKSQALSGLQ
jgi:predicted alternative tryptophan synthase beta-subunit